MGWLPKAIEDALPDPDQVFSYDTVKLVRILDRRLGCIYWGVQSLVVIYMVVIVFGFNKAYQDTEKSTGWILTKVMKPQYDHIAGISWDVFDTVTNPGESGAVFIPIRVLVTQEQTQERYEDNDWCQDPSQPCKFDSDCKTDATLSGGRGKCKDGLCVKRQWCPAEDPNNLTTELRRSEQYTRTHFLAFDEVELWFKTYVHFHKFALDVTTADENGQIRYPESGANTYRLIDLMRMTNYVPEEIEENGAVMTLNVMLDCNLDTENCEMKVETASVDHASGFNHVVEQIYWLDGVRTRDVYRMYGIRIVAFATGFGGKTKFSQIILQLSSAIALLGTAELIADFWLTSILPERKHYTEQKIALAEVSQD